MARRMFDGPGGRKFVRVDRDADDELLQWRAARRLIRRAGVVELIIERDDGTYRSLGDFYVDELDDPLPDAMYELIEDVIESDDGAPGYWGTWTGTVTVVAR